MKLRKKKCKVIHSPIDVKFAPDVVLQPDIIVVCDLSKIDKNGGCNGAPDLVVEALSPSTQKRDWNEKYQIYEKYGVREYWIASPSEETLTVFKLGDNGKYFLDHVYFYEDKVKVGIFDDIEIDLLYVFEKYED